MYLWIVLFLAMFFLIIGHMFKVLRWKQILEVYEEPSREHLLRALSVGYLINFFFPYRVGDVFRAFFVGRKLKNGFSFACSSVIVDRYLDVIVVGIIFGILSCLGISSDDIVESTKFYVIFAVVLIFMSIIAIKFNKLIKKIVKRICSLFNTKIKLKFLFFFWSIITAFKDTFKKISKVRMLIFTILMWGGYLSSYYFMSLFISEMGKKFTLLDVFTTLFSRVNLDSSSAQVTINMHPIGFNIQFIIAMYLLCPIIFLLLFSYCTQHTSKNNVDTISLVKKLNLLPQINEEERLNFLDNYFCGERRDYLEKYLEINRNINVLQDFSAGSNATTLLCLNNDRTFYRKYAFGDDGNKLNEQVIWLHKHQGFLPLPTIINEIKGSGYCCYDMEYNASSVGLFQYIHSMPIENSWKNIEMALFLLESELYGRTSRLLNEDLLKVYIKEKIIQNVEKIESAKELKGLMGFKEIIINGVAYKNFPILKKYLTENHLFEIFRSDTCADIHGDLTIENIICNNVSLEKQELYFIDPNTGNKHDSPSLDYGKLLQSLHGGYEFLMKTFSVDVYDNKIEFLFTKSYAYNEIFMRYKAYLLSKFPREKVKSIFYHEIVHWLRLMPYKIAKNGKRAILFYAELIIVFNDVVTWFEEPYNGKE